MSFLKEKIKEEESHDEKGRLTEKKFTLNGKLEGEYTSYYDNGQIMVRLFFRNDKREGESASYYRDAQVREKGT
jgi:antitoxin component YwqK of YwqJK toxin-antitoxin module